MAYPTPVNNQITDAVTQPDVLVLGLSPAVAASVLYQAVAQAMGNAAGNATVAQQQGSILFNAVAATGVAIVYAQQPKSA
jgi:hypothetical protein